jgi:hypothetical protein
MVWRRLHRLNSSGVANVDENGRPYRQTDGLIFEDDPSVIEDWLRDKIGDLDEDVAVLWDRHTAVVVPVAVFLDFRPEFHHFGAESVAILPFSENWLIYLWRNHCFFTPLGKSSWEKADNEW